MQRIGRIFPLIVALTLPASGLARNIQTAALNGAVETLNSCPTRSLLLNFDIYRDGQAIRQVPVWRLQDDAAFFFASGMMIDADGAPNAYNPEDTGLDDLSNAGQPGHWDGIIADEEGNPVLQGPDDPFPGYYISCTALSDWTKERIDPTRYVDASKIPYIALPGELARDSGARLGDLAVVVNTRNGRFSYAIFADIGKLGEGSIALADNLGIWSDARHGGRWGGILYLVFPGSGEDRPMSVEEINERTEALFHDWGGIEHVRSCADLAPESPAFRCEWSSAALLRHPERQWAGSSLVEEQGAAGRSKRDSSTDLPGSTNRRPGSPSLASRRFAQKQKAQGAPLRMRE